VRARSRIAANLHPGLAVGPRTLMRNPRKVDRQHREKLRKLNGPKAGKRGRRDIVCICWKVKGCQRERSLATPPAPELSLGVEGHDQEQKMGGG